LTVGLLTRGRIQLKTAVNRCAVQPPVTFTSNVTSQTLEIAKDEGELLTNEYCWFDGAAYQAVRPRVNA
ncbi:MAG: hypothetical protein ACREEM_38450, partial [Blastocatellia bacterium]